jgi:hypothetical protein
MKTSSKWIIALAIIGTVAGTAIAEDMWPPAAYGQQVIINFNLADSNSPWRFYGTPPAAADVHIIKDGGTPARATNAVTLVGKTMYLVLTPTEMTSRTTVVEVNDASSPKLYMDKTVTVPTFGNALAYQEPNSLTKWFSDAATSADLLSYVSITSGTAQAGTVNTIQLAIATSASTILTGCTIVTTKSGAIQMATIQSYAGATDTATIYDKWPSYTPDSSTTYAVYSNPFSVFLKILAKR